MGTAAWSLQAHDLKVKGSKPVPETKIPMSSERDFTHVSGRSPSSFRCLASRTDPERYYRSDMGCVASGMHGLTLAKHLGFSRAGAAIAINGNHFAKAGFPPTERLAAQERPLDSWLPSEMPQCRGGGLAHLRAYSFTVLIVCLGGLELEVPGRKQVHAAQEVGVQRSNSRTSIRMCASSGDLSLAR